MRLFAGVPIPAPLAGRLARWTEVLAAPRVRRAAVEEMHVTLHFLGEVASARRAAAEDCLNAAGGRPFEASLEGLGAFPDWRAPRVLWAGVAHGADLLTTLAGTLARSFAAAGFPAEDRTFLPHVTLARFPALSAGLSGPLESARKTAWGSFAVDRVVLFESRPVTPRYVPLKEVRL